MERSFIQEGLSKFVDELTSQTYLGTFRCQKRSSLLADGLGTRANSIWKMANYIVAYKEENEKEEHNVAKEYFLKGWSELCRNYKNQFLILEIDDQNNWEMYDSYGNLLGGNEFIKEYLASQKRENKGNAPSPTTPSEDILTSNQVVFFGSPGTGKSHGIKKYFLDNNVSEELIFRVTFHPDTDYASFVGCYKPTTETSVTNHQPILGYDGLVIKLKDYLDRSYLDPKTQKSYKNVNKACVVFGFEQYDSLIAMLKEDNDEHTIRGLINDAYDKDNSTYDTPIRAGMTARETMNELDTYFSRIVYKYTPQTFTNAYVKAWQNPAENVYLVIEEINRGNCAQIFGDLFQLLDRDDNGISEYPIKADADLTKYLQEKLGTNHEGIADGKIKLPSNLSIIATMNTSDQSLFPMDSAFKRRWEWKYVPTSVIGDKKKTLQVESKEETVLLNREQEKKILRLGMYEYDWSVFLEKINKCITDATHSDDKQLGFWFVKTPKDSSLINIETFVSKVIFYLWTDVFKDFGAKATNPFAFKTAEGGMVVCPFSSFFDPYTGEINLGQIHRFMYNLGIIPELEPEIQAAIEKNIVEEGNPEA